jgi:hypothetical protein
MLIECWCMGRTEQEFQYAFEDVNCGIEMLAGTTSLGAPTRQ